MKGLYEGLVEISRTDLAGELFKTPPLGLLPPLKAFMISFSAVSSFEMMVRKCRVMWACEAL